MNCYNHHEHKAVAICKNCNKGLCKECLTEVKNGIACTATCIEEVEKLNGLVEKSMGSYTKTSGALNRSAIFYVILGLAFIYFGFEDELLFMKIMGGLFLVGAALTLSSAKSYGKK